MSLCACMCVSEKVVHKKSCAVVQKWPNPISRIELGHFPILCSLVQGCAGTNKGHSRLRMAFIFPFHSPLKLPVKNRREHLHYLFQQVNSTDKHHNCRREF